MSQPSPLKTLHHATIILFLSILLFTAPLPTARAGPPAAPPLAIASHYIAIATGHNHSCAITSAGGVQCWGRNNIGQLGDNTTEQRDQPVNVSGISSGATALAAGLEHTCAVVSGGVKCWGNNLNSQLGVDKNNDPFSYTPVNVTALTSGVSAVIAGQRHSCALLTSGGMKCWGANGSGQLGNNSNSESFTPVDVSGLTSGVLAMAAGLNHTCALISGNTARCWGANTQGQLGNGNNNPSSVPVNVSGLASATAIATSGNHTCAIASGGAKCWGSNFYGQLGVGGNDSNVPVDVTNLTSGVVSITVGGNHSCAIVSDNSARCWGYNGYGQLGNNGTTNSSTPVNVSNLTNAAQLAGGLYHTCALTSANVAYCWGDNRYGQIGDQTSGIVRTPSNVSGLSSGVLTMTVGGSFTCALTSTVNATCWGENLNGQLGDASTTNRLTPTPVAASLGAVKEIVGGSRHACAITTSNSLKCWGFNSAGQVGNNQTGQNAVSSPTNATVLTTTVVSAVAVGDEHTCVLTSSGGVKCFGNNSDGQLGDNSTTSSATPVDVVGLSSGVVAIGSGYRFTCALTSGNGVKCWGANLNGRIGDGTFIPRPTPTDVSGLTSGVAEISVGTDHACARLSGSNIVRCWGSNATSQLGRDSNPLTGGIDQSNVPLDVTNLSNASALAAGGLHTCAVISGNTAQCWGDNSGGQLGNNSVILSFDPVTVSGLNGIIRLDAGDSHNCALVSGGALRCWGSNFSGQMGNGTPTFRNVPTLVYDPVVPPAPDLAISKNDGRTTVNIGDVLTYTLTYTNLGGATATGIVLTESLPSGTTFVGPPEWLQYFSTSLYTRTVASLAISQSASLTFVVQVTSVPANGQYNNIASISAQSEVTLTNNIATDTNVAPPPPDLIISKDDGRTIVNIGELLTYTILYTNSGVATAANIILTETLPSDTIFVGPLGWNQVGVSNSYTRSLANLPTNTSASTQFVVQVTGLPPGNAYTNTVVIGASNETNTANNQATDTDTPPPLPDMTVGKSDGRLPVVPNDVLTYTIYYTNIGGMTANNVILTETISSDTLIADATGWTLVGGNVYTRALGSVAPGASGSVTISVQVFSIPASQYYTNTINIGASNEVNFSNNQALDVDRVPQLPDVTVSKTDGQTLLILGQIVTYTINYSNVGDLTADNIILTETLPLSTTFLGPADWTLVSGNTYTRTLGSLLGSQSAVVTISVQVNGKPASQFYTNTIALSADNDANANNNQATDVDSAAEPPDLTISKSDGRSGVNVGDVLTYTIVYTNRGGSPATNIILTETLPAGTAFSGAGWLQIGSSNQFTRTVPDLTHGQTASTNFSVQVIAMPADQRYTNTVSISAKDEITLTNNLATDVDTALPVNLSVSKTDNTFLPVSNQVLTYTINYQNNGTGTARNVLLTETLPNGLLYVGTGWNGAGAVYTRAIGTLGPGASGNVTFIAQVDPNTSGNRFLTNTVQIGFDGVDTDPSNNTATDADFLQPSNLELFLDDGLSAAPPNQALAYSFVIRNLGSATAISATLTTTATTLVNVTNSAGWTPVGNGFAYTRTLPPIAPGATITVLMGVAIKSSATVGSQIVQSAQVDASGDDPSNNSFSDTDFVQSRSADIQIVNATLPSAVVGRPSTLFVTLRNAGNAETGNWFFMDAYINRRPQNRLDLGTSYIAVASADYAARALRIASLTPGETRTVEFPIVIGALGAHQVYIQADTCDISNVGPGGNCLDRSFSRIPETDEFNNIYGPISVTVTSGFQTFLPLIAR